MRVSVVVCGYDAAIGEHLIEAAESVLSQTYEDVELVVVIDGTEILYNDVVEVLGENDEVVLECNNENIGLSQSRNIGIELASGDVIAFMDDDAVATQTWVSELVDTYQRRDALAVGGRMAPRWVSGKPDFLPPEFYWLIGVTYRGYPEEETMVRNTFGSNISFRADIIEELGGFKPQLGVVGNRQIQGEETELAARMRAQFDEGVWYNPRAVVEHKIFERRTNPIWLTKRAFWQGYSKYLIERMLPDGIAREAESEFLRNLVTTWLPERIGRTVTTRSLSSALQFIALIVFTGMVGCGYLYGILDTLSNEG